MSSRRCLRPFSGFGLTVVLRGQFCCPLLPVFPKPCWPPLPRRPGRDPASSHSYIGRAPSSENRRRGEGEKRSNVVFGSWGIFHARLRRCVARGARGVTEDVGTEFSSTLLSPARAFSPPDPFRYHSYSTVINFWFCGPAECDAWCEFS